MITDVLNSSTPRTRPAVNLNFTDDVAHIGTARDDAASALLCDRSAAVLAEGDDGDFVSYAADTPVITSAGLVFNPASQQLLPNSKLYGANVSTNALPSGLSVTSGVTVDVISVADVHGLPSLTVELSVTNSDVVEHTYGMQLAPSSTIAAAEGEVFTLSAWVEIISSTNVDVADVVMRLSARDGSGAAIGGDTRTAVSGAGTPRSVVTATMPAGVAHITPSVTLAVPASTTSTIRLRVSAPQLEKVGGATAFIETHPDIVNPIEKFAYPAPGGATVAGALPTGWNSSGMTSVNVTAVDSTSVTLELNATNATGVDATASLRMAPSLEPLHAAVVGQSWTVAAATELISATSGSLPRLSIGELNSVGTSLASQATSIPTGVGSVSTTRTLTAALVAYVRPQITITVPAGSSVTVELKLSLISVKFNEVTSPNTGLATREAEVVSLSSAAVSAAAEARTVVVDGYLNGPTGDETWLTLEFGATKARLYVGAAVGVVASNGGGEVARAEQAVATYRFGRLRVALSWSDGRIGIAYGLGVGDFRSTGEITVPGLVADDLSAVYLGSDDGDLPCSAPLTAVKFLTAEKVGDDLALQTTPSWGLPIINAPIALSPGTDILDSAAFVLTPSSDPLATIPIGCVSGYILGQDLDPPQEETLIVYAPDPDAPYVIPVDIAYLSKYGPPDPINNPDRSIPHPCWQAIYLQQVNVTRKFSSWVVGGANAWLQGDQARAHSSLRLLHEWAEAGAMLGQKNETAFFQMGGNILTGITQAYACIRGSGGTAKQHETILNWFQAICDQMEAHMETRYGWRTIPALNNHYYWEAAGLASAGRVLNNGRLIDFGIQAMKNAIDGANIHGAWPAELGRGDHAAGYQIYCHAPVALLSELCLAAGFDPYTYADGKYLTILEFSLATIEDASVVEAEQQWQRDNVPGYEDMTVIEQIPIPIVPTDAADIPEGMIPRESNCAWVIIPYRRLTTEQAPWRALWGDRVTVYDNGFTTGLGGPVGYLFNDQI